MRIGPKSYNFNVAHGCQVTVCGPAPSREPVSMRVPGRQPRRRPFHAPRGRSVNCRTEGRNRTWCEAASRSNGIHPRWVFAPRSAKPQTASPRRTASMVSMPCMNRRWKLGGRYSSDNASIAKPTVRVIGKPTAKIFSAGAVGRKSEAPSAEWRQRRTTGGWRRCAAYPLAQSCPTLRSPKKSSLNIPLEFSSFFCRFAARHAVVSVEFEHAEQHACKVTCQCTQCLHVGLALSPLSVVERA